MSTNQLFLTIDYVTLVMLVALFSLTTSCLALNETGNQAGNQIVNKVANKALFNSSNSSSQKVAEQNSTIILTNSQIILSVNKFKKENKLNESRLLNLKNKDLIYNSIPKENELKNTVNYGKENTTTKQYQSTNVYINQKSSESSTIRTSDANDYLSAQTRKPISSYKLSTYLISFNLSDNSSITNLNKNDSFNYEQPSSTPMSVNRAKRSTTANYRFNLDNTKTINFQNYHTPSESISTLSANSSSSSKYHPHQDNQFILKQTSLANDLNNVEITYSLSTDKYSRDYSPSTFKRFTIDNLDQIDDQFTNSKKNQFFTSKPNLSNSLTPSLTPFDTFTSSLSSSSLNYAKDLYKTSRSYDLYSNFYTTTTINTKNKNKITNLFENTATSLLPLLLFDRHQLAQEELNFKFSNNNLASSPKPVYHQNLNASKSSKHDKKSKYLNKHIQSTEHHNYKDKLYHLDYLDHSISKLNNNKLSRNERIESQKLPINVDNLRLSNKVLSDNHWDEFNQISSTVPTNEWLLLNKQSVSYLNLDYDDIESNSSFLNDQPIDEDAFKLATTIKDDEIDESISKEFRDLIDNSQPSNLQSDRHHSKLGLLSINSINRNVSINSLFSINNSSNYSSSTILSPGKHLLMFYIDIVYINF